jgi:hypothetical protein
MWSFVASTTFKMLSVISRISPIKEIAVSASFAVKGDGAYDVANFAIVCSSLSLSTLPWLVITDLLMRYVYAVRWILPAVPRRVFDTFARGGLRILNCSWCTSVLR